MRLALIGEKLGHSLSVPIHEQYFGLTGAPGSYRLMEVAPEALKDLRALLAREALDGVNVTIPYKQAVIPLLDELTEEARAIGAVNTIARREGRLIGHNTDAIGLRALLGFHGISVRGKTCALLGATGGAAQAARHALLREDVGKLFLVSRAPAGQASPDPRAEWISYERLSYLAAEVLVNATPVGMAPDICAAPARSEVCARAEALVDMIYNPPETRFLAYGRQAGRKTANGLMMLVAQAVAAQAFWTGRAAGEEVSRRIYERMRAVRV